RERGGAYPGAEEREPVAAQPEQAGADEESPGDHGQVGVAVGDELDPALQDPQDGRDQDDKGGGRRGEGGEPAAEGDGRGEEKGGHGDAGEPAGLEEVEA